MQNEQEKKAEEAPILEDKFVQIMIPICCREGWDSCKHCVKKPKKLKSNVGV